MKTSGLIFFSFWFLFFTSCTQEPTNYSGEYPDDVRLIIENKCATAGCHNEKSFTNAANLRLDRWEHLWKGSGTGSVLIPYNPANSSLLYFINTDPAQGPVLLPQMPLNMPSLSQAEYATIKAWVAAGAPDKTGKIPFAANPDKRQKIYITQQGCDLIAVVDAESNLIMRYIDIGTQPGIEIAHCVRFSPDGKFAYVSFTKGQYIQKIDVESDAVVGSVFLGAGSWNLFKLSDDGKEMAVSDFSSPGRLVFVDLEKMKLLEERTIYDLITPHGIASTPGFDTFFVTSQIGNTVYRITKNGSVKLISIDENEPNPLNESRDPHEILFSPDRSKYFVTCQKSDEVRVMDAHTNLLLKVLPVGAFPQEIAISKTTPYIFVSCEEEVTAEFPGYKGAVYVIDYNTLELVKRIPGPFYQIHGITVDDKSGKVFVASRNVSSTGPAPHHTSQCGGRNGFYSVIDLNTLQLSSNKRFESTVDPYSADVRFK